MGTVQILRRWWWAVISSSSLSHNSDAQLCRSTTSSNLASVSVSVSTRMWMKEPSPLQCRLQLVSGLHRSSLSIVRSLRRSASFADILVTNWRRSEFHQLTGLLSELLPCWKRISYIENTHTHRWSQIYIPVCFRRSNRQAYRKIITEDRRMWLKEIKQPKITSELIQANMYGQK